MLFDKVFRYMISKQKCMIYEFEIPYSFIGSLGVTHIHIDPLF